MVRQYFYAVFLAIVALHTLAEGALAIEVHATGEILVAGNAVPVGTGRIWTKAILAMDEIPVTAWQWTGQRTSFALDLGDVRASLRTEMRWKAAMSRETVMVLQSIVDPSRPPLGDSVDLGLTYSAQSYRAIDVSLPRRMGPWTAYLKGSVLFGTHFETLSGVGRAYSGYGESMHLHLQTMEQTSTSGLGWSVGGGAAYARPGYRIALDVQDAVGRLHWSDGVVRKGVMNSNTLVRDESGYPTFAPLTQGAWYRRDLVSSPVTRLSLRYDQMESRGMDEGRSRASIQLDLIDGTLFQLTGTVALAPEVEISLGAFYPAPGVLFGLQWDTLRVTAALEPFRWRASRTIVLQAGYTLRY